MSEDPNDNESDTDRDYVQGDIEAEIDSDKDIDNSEQFDPNETDDSNTQSEFDPNASDREVNLEEFNPNTDGEIKDLDFDPNSAEGNLEQDEFDPNDSGEEKNTEQFKPNEGEEDREGESYDQNDIEGDLENDPYNNPYEGGDDFEQERYSGEFGNEYANAMSTLLISENEMYAYIQEYVEAMLKNENEPITQEEQNQKDNIEDGPSELEQFLEQEKERIRVEQQQAELEKNTDIGSEAKSFINEEEVEQEPSKEIEPQVDSSEEISPSNEEEIEHQEEQEKLVEPELEPAISEEEVEQEQEKEFENTEQTNEPELEQTEIEEEFNDPEMEREELQTNHEVEELNHEEKIKQQELEVAQEIHMNETENETIYQEEESEFTSLYKELEDREIEESEDPQEELEEILEQVSEIEQETLTIGEQEQEVQEQLHKATEVKNEAKGTLKGEGSKENEIEQEKEEEWLTYLVNWVKEESGEEISYQFKEEITETSEKYDELDDLTTKFLELYQKEQTDELSQSEKIEFKTLIKALEKEEPSHIVLFTNLRAINRYLTRQKLKKTQLNQILYHLFTRFSPKKQISQILKAKNQPLTKEAQLFEKFLQSTHENEFIKNLVNEFNKSGNWIKNLRPTQTFINFLKQKLEQLNSQKTRSTIVKERVTFLSNYLSLISKIRTNNSLAKAIKNLFLNTKGKYNAFDIQNWLLITENAARNQLKKMFTEEEYQKFVRTQKHISIKIIREIAKKEGGKCLTKQIKNAKSKIDLECAEGHKWTTTYNSVVYSKTWCPHCHIYMSEEVCRQFFERIFKRLFPKIHPLWLNGRELDGGCEELRVAFEKQGEQHRKNAFGLSYEEIRKIQEEDADKLQKCTEHGWLLLQIPDTEIVPWDDMQNCIIKLYEEKSGKSLGNVPKYDWREFTIHENKHAKKFQKHIEEKGGTLLSSYFTAKKQVTILCQRGHKWNTTPDSIYKGNWCPECAGNKKGTTEEYRKIGEKFQCELLDQYTNAKTPLRYRCLKGHVFPKGPYWLKKAYKKAKDNPEEFKNICPECEKVQYAHKFQTFVKNKGGTLLKPYYGRFKPVQIRCKNDHEWESTPGAIYQGQWCKTCANNKKTPNKKRQETAKQAFLEKIESSNYTLLSKYEKTDKKVKIKCQRNHMFTITPNYFKQLVNRKIEPCGKCRKKEV